MLEVIVIIAAWATVVFGPPLFLIFWYPTR
jgi:hypothetical protein